MRLASRRAPVQFMHQEKGDTAAVCSFAARKGAKWPVFDKARFATERASAAPNGGVSLTGS